MSHSGGMSQLLKGVIIGVVLIMAIIGTMSLLTEDNLLSSFMGTKDTSNASSSINAPSITLNPNKQQDTERNSGDTNIGDLNAEITEVEEIKEVKIKESEKPVLENERTSELIKNEKAPSLTYGIIELKSVNPSSGQALKANYIVTNASNVKVAESKDQSNASYRLPSGQYKVETTLTAIDEATNKSLPVLTKSRYVIIRENATTNLIFELEPPATTGVLQVSATINDKATRANFVIQKANGEVIASRNNVTNSLFKLKTGSYKVSVENGTNKDFRSVEVKAGESTQTVFILKEAAKQGKLLVRIFDTKSSNPIRADIKITSSTGSVIRDLKSATQTELTLAQGDYKISVIGPNGTSNKNIKVNPGQSLSEVFRFNVLNTENTDETASKEVDTTNDDNSTKITENVTIKPVNTNTQVNPVETPTPEANAKSILSIAAQDETTKKPIKSNIYIQTPSGKHLDKKTYVDGANFSLDPGVYKVTVRAKDRVNNVKTIKISANNNVSETFLLAEPNSPEPQVNNQQEIPTETIAPTNTPKKIETGFLNVAMRASSNSPAQANSLKTHFIVTKINGQKIVELTSVNLGNFKLDVGSYFVTAINNNKRQRRRVDVRPNQNTRLNFNLNDFLAAKGTLRSRIINEVGSPLKGNLIVRNNAGQIVARANDVSSAVFNLPPVKHTIIVNFQGLSGSEVVNINTDETTIQTFTIASNPNRSRNSSRDLQDALREKVEKEIRRAF